MTAYAEDSSIGHAAHRPEDDRAAVGVSRVSNRAKTILLVVGIVVLTLAILMVSFLTWHKRHVATEQREEREKTLALGPRVNVITVGVTSGTRSLTLPGDVRGYQQITLYAKISGYVRDIRVERGQKVAADQIMAVIFSPENDEQVRSARSDAEVKKINAERALRLAVPGVISDVDRDNALNSARMADAELARVGALREYELVRAPFAGVVTARYVDNGALLPAATGSTQAAQPVVDLADIDLVRVFSYVGQDAAPFIHQNDAVEIWQDERPEQIVHAGVTRCTESLDPRTRTMQCEIDFDNRPYGILPGTFVHVRVRLKVPPSPAVPDDALVVKDGKNMVAVIDETDDGKGGTSGKIRYVEVELGTNDGRTMRVQRGLKGGETIALSPPMELEDGNAVQPVHPPPPVQQPQSGVEKFAPPTTADAGRPTLDSNSGGAEKEKK